MKKIYYSLAPVIFLVACTSTTEDSKDADNKIAKVDKMVCEHRATTGSHRKKRTCMSKKLSDEIRRNNQNTMRKVEKTSTIIHKG